MGEESKKGTQKIYNDAYSDQRLFAIQKSTRSRFRIFQKLNEKLRLRFKWYYNLRIDSLYLYDTPEEQMFAIQRSTRTTIKYLQPLHEKLRQKSRLYYKWHIRPESHKVHWAALCLFAIATIFLIYTSPSYSKATIDFAPELAEKNINYSKIYTSVKSDATEVVSKRTENTKVFRNSDGTEQYIITGGPLHYKDTNGKWKNIDSSIIAKEDGSGFVMDESIYSAYFNKNFTSDPLIMVNKDGQNLTMKPGELSYANISKNQSISNPLESTGESNGHSIIYKNAYGPGLDFAYETQDYQLNKKLNIASLASLPTPIIDMTSETDANLKLALQFGLNAGMEIFIGDKLWDGTETTIQKENLIFKKDGKVFWQLTPPKAWDATGEDKAITGQTTIIKTDGKLNMAIQFPYSWLKNAQYPVTIDPDTYYGATTDAYIGGTNNTYATAQSTSYTYSDSVTFSYLGQDNSSTFGYVYGVARDYLEFDTSGIDDASIVTQANLYLTARSNYSTTDFTVRVHEYAWTSPIVAGNREANYDGAPAATTNAVDWRGTSGMSLNTAYASSNLRTDYIQKGATKTKYALVSNRDVAVTTPTTPEYITIYTQNNASMKPYLSIITSNNSCQSAATGNWNDPTKWTSCNGGYPEATDSVTILNGHTITMTADASITTGSLTINSGGQLNTGDFNLTINNLTNNGTLVAGYYVAINVAGNWTNNNIFTPNESFTTFNGSGDQTISGSGAHDFWLMNVLKTGGKLILGAAVTISGSGGFTSLYISDSTINLQTYDLTISGSSDGIYSFANSTPYTFIEGTGKTIILADNLFISESGAGIYNYGNVQIGDGSHSPSVSTYDLGGGTTYKFGTFNIAAGIFAQGYNDVITTGNFTIAATGATFTKGIGAVKLKLLGDLTFTGPSTPQDLGAVEIGASPDTTDLASDFAATSLTINSGDIFNTNGYEVDIGTGGIFLTGTLTTTDDVETDGTIITDAGNFTVNSGGTFTKDITSTRSLLKMDGGTTKTLTSDGEDLGDFQTSTASTHIDMQDNTTFAAVTIDTTTLLDTVSGANRSINATSITLVGTLTANASTITLSGDWNSSAGTFTYGTSTVKMIGTSKTISPASGQRNDLKFYDLTIDTGASVTSSYTHFAVHNLLVNGTFNISGKIVEPLNLTAIGADGDLTGTGELFQVGYTTNTVSNAGTISISKFTYDINTDTTSSPIIATDYGSNCTLTIRRENSTGNPRGGVVVVNPGRADTVLTAGTIIVGGSGSSYSTSLDNSVSNYPVNVANITVGGTGVDYGNFTTGSGVITATDNILINAGTAPGNNILNASANPTINIAGNWTNGDTFTANTATVTFNGAVAQAITGTNTFYNLTINNTYAIPSDTYDVDPGSAQTVTNTLTITDGQWTPCTGDSYKDIVISTNGIIKPDAGATITVSGNWDSSLGLVTYGTSTIEITGDSTITTKNWTNTFYNLKTAYTGKAVTWLGNGIITHQLILDGNATGSFSSTSPAGPSMSGNGSGYDLITSGGATFGSSTKILFTGANAIIPAPVAYPNVDFAVTSDTQTLGASISSGNVRIFGTTSGTATLDLAGYNMTVTGTIDVGVGVDRYGKIVNTSQTTNSSLSVTGNFTIVDSTVGGSNIVDASGTGGAPKTINLSVGGNFVNNETFTAGASTVTFNGTSSGKTINTGGTGSGKDFYNLVISGAGGAWTITTNNLVTTNLTVTAGTLATGLKDLTVTGTPILDGGNLTGGAGAMSFGTCVAMSCTGGLTISDMGSTFTASSDTTINSEYSRVYGAYADWVTNGSTLTSYGSTGFMLPADEYYHLNLQGELMYDMEDGTNIDGNLTVSSNGSLYVTAGTVAFIGTSTQTITGSVGFFNLSVSDVSSIQLETDISIAGDYYNEGTFDANGYGLTVSGAWENPGNFIPKDGTVTFNGTGAQVISGTETQIFSYLVVEKTAGQTLSVDSNVSTLTVTDFTEISGNFTASASGQFNINRQIILGAGIFSAGANTNIVGDWLNYGGTFTPGTGTVTFKNGSGTAGATYNSTISGTVATQTFNNLVLNKPSGGAENIGLGSLRVLGSTMSLSVHNYTQTAGNFTASSTFTITGDLILTANALSSSGSIYIAGNWTNNGGTYYAGTVATGYINYSGLPTDGDTFTISDGTNTAVVEYDTNSSCVETGTRYCFTSATNSAIAAAVNRSTIDIVASTYDIYMINFTGTVAGLAENIEITRSGSQPSTMSGMSGGTDNTGTVTFNGTGGQTITGDNTFNYLDMDTNTNGANQINFEAGSTQTILGAWTLDGDTGKVLTLRSTVSDTAWLFDIQTDINPAGDWIDVQDSQTATAYRINPGANTTNSGNNSPGWNFGITLSIDNPTLSFASLLPGDIFTGYTETTVSINYLSGYSLYISDSVAGSDSTLLHDDGTTRIIDFSGTFSDPSGPLAWMSGYGLGVCPYLANGKNETKWGAGTSPSDISNLYAGVPQNDAVLFTNTDTTISNDGARIGYKLVVPNTQKTGNYEGEILYTAVPSVP